jgi:catechol 2,3-dioxygenase
MVPPGEESPYPDRPQRAGSQGVRVRLLDHVTVTAPDVKATLEWHRDALDFRIMAAVESSQPDAPEWFFGVATQTEKSHDFGFIQDFDGIPGRLHHLAFWVETNHDLTEGAKFILEHGHELDYGPGQHGIGEQNYLYFRDPAGLRYELNSGGYRNYVPDWENPLWTFDDAPNNAYFTEIGMPAVHMVAIPPGQAGRVTEDMVEGPFAKG